MSVSLYLDKDLVVNYFPKSNQVSPPTMIRGNYSRPYPKQLACKAKLIEYGHIPEKYPNSPKICRKSADES